MSLRSDDLDSVVELYTEDKFRQLVVTAETMPTFLGGLCKLEDHGESGLVREAPVLVGNSRSEILVMQSAQNWHRQRATDGLDSARDRRILVQ